MQQKAVPSQKKKKADCALQYLSLTERYTKQELLDKLSGTFRS